MLQHKIPPHSGGPGKAGLQNTMYFANFGYTPTICLFRLVKISVSCKYRTEATAIAITSVLYLSVNCNEIGFAAICLPAMLPVIICDILYQYGGVLLSLIPYFLMALFIWNSTVFFLYAMDKHRARRGRWRVKERTLLRCSFLAGGIGGCFGMYLLRHKTQHLKFRILQPLAGLITAAFIVFLLFFDEIIGKVL